VLVVETVEVIVKGKNKNKNKHDVVANSLSHLALPSINHVING
jgi:hypothetical protein